MAGEVWRRSTRQLLGRTQSESRERMLVLAHLLLLVQSWTPVCGMALPTYKVAFSSHSAQITFHSQALGLVSMVILNPIKLTTRTGHHHLQVHLQRDRPFLWIP